MGETFNFSIKKNWKKWTCGRRPMKMIRIFKCFPKSINLRALRRLYKKWKCMTHVRRRFASPLAVNSHVRVEWVANGIGCRYLSTYLLSLSLSVSLDLIFISLSMRFARIYSGFSFSILFVGMPLPFVSWSTAGPYYRCGKWTKCARTHLRKLFANNFLSCARARAFATQNF